MPSTRERRFLCIKNEYNYHVNTVAVQVARVWYTRLTRVWHTRSHTRAQTGVCVCVPECVSVHLMRAHVWLLCNLN